MMNSDFTLSPQEIFEKLNEYVVGQSEAKKIIAIAFRNRKRRMVIDDSELRNDIVPKNVLMVGPTGVGKTEIVRRASKICNFPFIKVEASRFTEVGYVGKDVESIIKELLDKTVASHKQQAMEKFKKTSFQRAKIHVLGVLHQEMGAVTLSEKDDIRKRFEAGEFNNTKITINLKEDQPSTFQEIDIPGMSSGIQMGMISISDVFKSGDRYKRVEKIVPEAISALANEYSEEMIDEKEIIASAIKSVEECGVVFLDEIDKLVTARDAGGRGEISREGVQRDLLPIIEGASVMTKHGYVDTRHILFIACGAFHSCKPSDLLPELQGRLPIRAQLKNLTKEDFVKILTITKNNLIKQHIELLKTDGVEVLFSEDGIQEIASLSSDLNTTVENIGARRLHAVIEKVVEDISFEYPKMNGKKGKVKSDKILIDAKFVADKMSKMMNTKTEYSKFIL